MSFGLLLSWGVMVLLYVVPLVSDESSCCRHWSRIFALRIRKNIKQLWMDVHNALGIVSLPFHLVMHFDHAWCLPSGDGLSGAGRGNYPSGLRWENTRNAAAIQGAPLPASRLLRKVNAYPDFTGCAASVPGIAPARRHRHRASSQSR